jgi:site-specific DNA-adenine methylase
LKMKMKNKLTNKFLAVAIILVSLNAFSIAITPFITISTNHVNATVGTAITPVTITNTNSASLVYYSISPAISNGLSFNKKTGTISGVPIVVSDSVTYTVTAVLMARMKVDYHGQDTATVVIAVGVGTINLALGKPATQSSTFLYHSINPVAGYAVNGNTDGYFLNKSTTHTNYEQGAWWQVDLGSKKDIKQIIIYNRTDCCAARLSNYQVSISNKADFSTHTYQQDFHVAPNPRKIIQLDASGKQGRYVRIQLLDSDYLSLAEVQVMGVDPLRFAEVDFSSALNNFGGWHYDAPNYPNFAAFAAVKADGSIIAWGSPHTGGTGAPSGSGYTKIYSNRGAFAALKADGSITAWGDPYAGGTGAPSGSSYTEIYSTAQAFAALKADGSITTWGVIPNTASPSDSGYAKIYSNGQAFAALKADGSIKAWGKSDSGGAGAPSGRGYTKIHSTAVAFAALKADGSITAWGNSESGGAGAPSDSGYVKIYSNGYAFAALKADGSIKAWGNSGNGGANAPTDKDYINVYSSERAFAALKADGLIKAWGDSKSGGKDAPTDKGYAKIYSNGYAFAALKADGSIEAWGDSKSDGKDVPTNKGYINIYSSDSAFAALKADGSITSWGDLDNSWGRNDKHINAPTDKGYTAIYSNEFAFVAVKPDGSIRTWGDPSYGGAYASGYNLALGKPATQSSTFLYHSINPVAGYAVDGNTDGYFLNKSTTHTEYAQGAWWQVDLGGRKNINEIIIYNRTDCCADRLSNYQVSISDKADFSTHTYQQDFHVAPNPKKIIQLNASGKQGRYVRIQLLDKNYLSLAEVQVMGVDL